MTLVKISLYCILKQKALLDLAVPLAKYVLSKLATNPTLPIIDNFERKISRKGAVRAGKGITLFISKKIWRIYEKDMNDIIKITESLEKIY